MSDPDRAVIAIADATPVYRAGLAAELADHDVLLAGTTAEIRELIARGPDLLVIDLRLVAADESLLTSARDSGVAVVVSVAGDAEKVLALVQDGVSGLWDREGDAAELRRIVNGALAGAPMVSPEIGAALMGRIAAAGEAARGTGQLTGREHEILELMADGKGNRAIADRLFISENTVRNHVRNVLDKLQARTRTEAVVRAVRAGLIRLG